MSRLPPALRFMRPSVRTLVSAAARTSIFRAVSDNVPLGAAIERSLADVIVRHDLYCLSDEIYEHIVYEGNRHVSPASLGPEIRARTITVNGMSKGYAMTGWRIGFIGAPKPLADAIGAIQSHGTHHPANASQYAALACLDDDKGFPRRLREHFTECRALALSRLAAIPGLEVFPPQGAFYAFFGVQAYLGRSSGARRIDTSLALCEYLLEEHLVVAVPGSAFGLEGFVRISFATDLGVLAAALDRIERGLLALKT